MVKEGWSFSISIDKEAEVLDGVDRWRGIIAIFY